MRPIILVLGITMGFITVWRLFYAYTYYENSTTQGFRRKSDLRPFHFRCAEHLAMNMKKHCDLTEKMSSKVFMFLSEHSKCLNGNFPFMYWKCPYIGGWMVQKRTTLKIHYAFDSFLLIQGVFRLCVILQIAGGDTGYQF